MRRGVLRFFALLAGGSAFALSAAGPPQWCICPMHGATMMASHAGSAAGDQHASHHAPAATHAPGNGDRHPANHQCSCPGCGCCSAVQAGLHAALVAVPLSSFVEPARRSASPSNAARLARSPQLLLHFATAPPAVGSAQQALGS